MPDTTPPADSPEPLPCPHCSGAPVAYRVPGGSWAVRCPACDAQPDADTRDAAIAAWNHRATPPQPVEPALSPTEALFGFGGWLTSRDAVLTASSRHNAAPIADAIEEFRLSQGLPPPAPGYADKLKPYPRSRQQPVEPAADRPAPPEHRAREIADRVCRDLEDDIARDRISRDDLWAAVIAAIAETCPADSPPPAEDADSPALDDNETDPAALWAEIARLREAVKGPQGYASWQDAATDERIKRVRMADTLRQCERVLDVVPYHGKHPDADVQARREAWLADCRAAIAAARAALDGAPQGPLGPPARTADAIIESVIVRAFRAALDGAPVMDSDPPAPGITSPPRWREGRGEAEAGAPWVRAEGDTRPITDADRRAHQEAMAHDVSRWSALAGGAQPAQGPSTHEIGCLAAQFGKCECDAGNPWSVKFDEAGLYEFARAVRAWPGNAGKATT